MRHVDPGKKKNVIYMCSPLVKKGMRNGKWRLREEISRGLQHMCPAPIATCSLHLSADEQSGSSVHHLRVDTLVRQEVSHAPPLKPKKYKPRRRAVRKAGEISAAKMFISEEI